jgi:hypothetical protein
MDGFSREVVFLTTESAEVLTEYAEKNLCILQNLSVL